MAYMPVRPYVKPALKYRIIFRKPTVNRVSKRVKDINDYLVKVQIKPATACHDVLESKNMCVKTVKYTGKGKEEYCRVPWKKFVSCLREAMKQVIEHKGAVNLKDTLSYKYK